MLPSEYRKPFDKKTAIRAMLDGYPVVRSTDPSKLDYNGQFIMFEQDRFFEIVGEKSIPIDVNYLPSKYLQIFHLTTNMIPQKIWKTNIENHNIIELTFNNIVWQKWKPKNRLKVLVEYYNNKGESIGIMFEKDFARQFRLKKKTQPYNPHTLSLVTVNAYFLKKHAQQAVREWVYEHVQYQKKAGKGRILKSTAKAQKIIDTLPEVFT
jgi:hypothetical protein